MQGGIWRRNRVLVDWLVGCVVSARVDGVGLAELVEGGARVVLDDGRTVSHKTVDNVIGDLCAFGVVRKVRRHGDVWIAMTVLGRAWLAGVDLPGLGPDLGPVVLELREVEGR